MCPAWINVVFLPSNGEFSGQKLIFLLRPPSPPPTAPQSQSRPYLVKGERPNAERGQLDGVQERDLNEAVGLRAPVGPVLVAFDLHQVREHR